jgi:hypothetical protein
VGSNPTSSATKLKATMGFTEIALSLKASDCAAVLSRFIPTASKTVRLERVSGFESLFPSNPYIYRRSVTHAATV